eukprot:CAMPEP_0115760160 /NCGR_PEP_ID=MMETSP0272-20121206/99848_1 /TAXON_ID=71861 /ORGANISM="Scrippsiella trochoidea, Strain CCMP3099" /LENGTH=102 /DNA_ID=CAMNT_0003205801 /DNA_START=109 /DNA_END=414 /DNA_ORIENTATION=-
MSVTRQAPPTSSAGPAPRSLQLCESTAKPRSQSQKEACMPVSVEHKRPPASCATMMLCEFTSRCHAIVVYQLRGHGTSPLQVRRPWRQGLPCWQPVAARRTA